MSSRELLLSAQFSIVRRYRYQRPVQQERNTPAIVILCSLFRSLSLSILLGPSGCILPGRLSCSTSLTILHSPFSVRSASLLSRRRLHFFPPAASSPTFPWPFPPNSPFLHLLSHSRPKRHRPRSHTSPRRKACRPLFLFRIWRLPAWTGSIFSCSRVRLRCSTFIGCRSGSLRHHRSHHTQTAQTQKDTHAGARIV